MATRPDRIKYLTDAEIQELLAQSDGELSDIDDPDFENIPESDTDSENLENDSLVYEEIDQPSTSKVGQKRKRIRTRWDNSEFMNFNLDDLALEFRDTGFQGEVLSPTEYFTNFFPEIFWKECVEQTNLYAFEKKRRSLHQYGYKRGADTVLVEDKQLYGLGGAVVKHLVGTIPTAKVTHIFTDRYFTGLAILDYLVSRNIYLTGTVMTNRTDGVAGSFPKDIDMERGSSVSRRREDGKACLVKWKDKKSVLLLSSAFRIKPEGSCKRWAKEQRQRACHCKVI
ncbi:piggyBac transposable element-derived protein 3 [Trichonephila clavipes]|uniref:PiggyBac transposable element-derived protein 3 n=1 Tax=Trichonephila clavipes TaxID=2585209 RepID=A0A8X6SDK3_TRICX|nr:piggyBac transposable element-derived protein 3 [Trichonephila clavipes]